MVVQLVFLLLLWPMHISAVQPKLSKPGCKDKCGSVTIPYPFGMGTNCFIGRWFEIECKNSSKPFLKKLNLEVLQILQPSDSRDLYSTDSLVYSSYLVLQGLIRINSPVFSSYCNRSNPGTAVDLMGSPFLFSQTANSFTAAGCKSRALMENIDPILIGCNSHCDGGCCQTTIPSNLKVFNASFEREENCKYAFLVERAYWPRSNSSCVAAVQHLDYVPALLEWGVSNSSLEADRLYQESMSSRTFMCDTWRGTIVCCCSTGFNGTAYLPDSCQDINECEDPKKCQHGGTCVNEIGSYRCDDGKFRIKIGVVIGLSCGLGLLILILIVWCLYKVVKKRNKIKRKKKFFKRNGGLLLEQQVSSSRGNVDTTKVFTSKELEISTDRFNKNRILGQGGQGTVYKGMLEDGRIVAVKKSKIESEETLIEQFINEVVILSKIDHRNIVKLLGCCLETEVPLLVYEFVPNGTLSQYLHGLVEDFVVSWEMRLQIATEIAGALSYLHSAASIPIYHRDIKSSNILLDDKYRAKVADFGTSRSVSIEQTHLTTLVHGTFGYLDPEYFRSSQFTDKSDVYSFGVVLVELLTGQKAVSSLGAEGVRSLALHFITKMEENQLPYLLDPQVAKQGGKGEVMAFANLAKRCLDLNGRNRPTMTEVRTELERISRMHKASTGNGDSRYEEMEPRDHDSTSTGTGVDSGTAISVDAQPLLPDPLW